MALKFLNKKGWHTGSLRNIENVWKAEQKHEAEQKKLEELKKQIHDERESLEFRHLQEQSGLIPKQERLDFLYNSGLAVGKTSSDDYLLGKPVDEKKDESGLAKAAVAPGALFVDEKHHSANDTWRKLHSDPLLLIKQQEQAALARIKNNPVKMEMIRKMVKSSKKEQESEKDKEKQHRKKKKRKMPVPESCCSSDGDRYKNTDTETHNRGGIFSGSNGSSRKEWYVGNHPESNRGDRGSSGKVTGYNPRHNYGKEIDVDRRPTNPERYSHSCNSKTKLQGTHSITNNVDLDVDVTESSKRSYEVSTKDDSHSHYLQKEKKSRQLQDGESGRKRNFEHNGIQESLQGINDVKSQGNAYETKANQYSKHKMKHQTGKLSEEEKAGRLRKMQADARVHEDQRWHRLKNASEADLVEEARQSIPRSGWNFLDVAGKSIYGADKGGSATVEESVRRRTHFIERSIGDSGTNTFRR